MPTEQDVAAVMRAFPDVRVDILASAGAKLSDTLQDGKSYRYGLVHLGGAHKGDLYERFEYAKQLLPFVFK